MIPARHELCMEISPRPGWVWAAALAAFVALPRLAATADTSMLKMTNYYASPSGVYQTLTVTGEAHVADAGADVLLLPAGSTTNHVGVGTTNPQTTFHVAGNVQVSGCIYLGPTKSKRCKWY